MRFLIAYDIGDDDRRSDVALLLSGYGPRVQLSVFEAEVTSKRELVELRGRLRELIDAVDDQIRIYPITVGWTAVDILGARVCEDRRDFWIV